MSDLFAVGNSGLRAYSRALSTTGDNIANSQTDGYARRSVRLSQGVSGGEIALYGANMHAGGVTVAGVERSVNEWLIADARNAGSDAGRTGARLSWISAAERTMDDSETGLGNNLTSVFNAADTLSSDPGNATLRQGFLQSVHDAAAAFRRTATGLEGISNGLGAEASASVAQFNYQLGQIAEVNKSLARAREGSTNQATLMDERDRLIDGIAGMAAVSIQFDGRGVASLQLAGSGGASLVSSAGVASLSVSQATVGSLSYTLNGNAVTPMSGRLTGLAEAGSQIAGQRATLNTLANQFVTQLNTAHQAGKDANGQAGKPLLDIGTSAASVQALSLTGAEVAAADSNSSNGNMMSLSNLRGPGGVEQGWAAQVAAQAQAVAATQAQDAAASTRNEGATAARSAVSSVDLDQEAGDLLRYQQAYEASARVVQVARDTIQSILSIF